MYKQTKKGSRAFYITSQVNRVINNLYTYRQIKWMKHINCLYIEPVRFFYLYKEICSLKIFLKLPFQNAFWFHQNLFFTFDWDIGMATWSLWQLLYCCIVKTALDSKNGMNKAILYLQKKKKGQERFGPWILVYWFLL